MRPSRVLREVRSGKIATCLKLNLGDPRVVELGGLMGFSSVWICNEHVLNDWSVIENSVRAGKLYDMDTIVRVSKGSYSDYVKPFECDAAGIMVPYVESEAEARRVVEMCRCHPLGARPMDGGNVDGEFCGVDWDDYSQHCNSEKFIVIQIESPAGVEQVEEIAAVPGYDFLLFGPGDFSHRIGKLGKIQDPEVIAARKRVEEAARRHGKWGFSVGGPTSPDEMFARGYRVALVASDILSLRAAFKDSLANFQAGRSSQTLYLSEPDSSGG